MTLCFKGGVSMNLHIITLYVWIRIVKTIILFGFISLLGIVF